MDMFGSNVVLFSTVLGSGPKHDYKTYTKCSYVYFSVCFYHFFMLHLSLIAMYLRVDGDPVNEFVTVSRTICLIQWVYFKIVV